MSSHSRNLIGQSHVLSPKIKMYVYLWFSIYSTMIIKIVFFRCFDTETLFEQNHLRIMHFLIIHCSAKKTIFVHWSKISIRLRFEALFVSYNRKNELIPVGQGCEKSFAAIDHLRSDEFKVLSGNEITIYFRNHVVAKKLS